MNPERLRIAMLARAVAPWHGVGGLERHVADMTRHLVRRGVRVTLVTPPPAQQGEGEDAVALPGLDDALRDGRLETRFVPYVTFPFAGRRGTTILDRITAYPYFGRRAGRVAQRLVDEGRAQIVHGLGASALGYAQARARDRIGTVPFIFNPQGLEEFGGTDPSRARLKTLAYRPLRAAVRVCADAADRVIATDDVLAPVVEAHLAVEEDRLRVIPNAVDLDAIDALASATNARGSGATAKDNERAPHGGGDSALLLAVGRLEANKGFHVLIEALARLWVMPGAPACHLVLVGDGPRRSALQRQAQEAGLGGQVHFLGRLPDDDVHQWYSDATLFVHPTLYEGSSLVTLEGDGAPVRRRRHRRGRHPRQSEAGRHRLARPTRQRRCACPRHRRRAVESCAPPRNGRSGPRRGGAEVLVGRGHRPAARPLRRNPSCTGLVVPVLVRRPCGRHGCSYWCAGLAVGRDLVLVRRPPGRHGNRSGDHAAPDPALPLSQLTQDTRLRPSPAVRCPPGRSVQHEPTCGGPPPSASRCAGGRGPHRPLVPRAAHQRGDAILLPCGRGKPLLPRGEDAADE